MPGYDIWFPKQWEVYGHARIILLMKSDLTIKEIVSPAINDLSVIMVEVGTQREPKTRIGFLYREYTNYVTGLNTQESQDHRLDRTLQALEILTIKDQNCLIMGDINVDHDRLQEPGYHLASFARKVVDFQVNQGYTQMILEPTREQLVDGVVKRSLLDVIYSNKEGKLLGVYQDIVGRSDHQGVRATIATNTKFPKGQNIKCRQYRNFDPAKFLYGVQNEGIDQKVCQIDDLEEAASLFGHLFGKVLDANAQIKTVQLRKNYNPHITELTKDMIKERNRLLAMARATCDLDTHLQARQLVTEVKNAVRKDKMEVLMSNKHHRGQPQYVTKYTNTGTGKNWTESAGVP